MANPTQYPWVNFNLAPTPEIDSTPLVVFTSPNSCIVDSIFICNTTALDIFINISIVSQRNSITQTTYLVRHFIVPKLGSVELVKNSVINIQAGDIIYANSDFSGNRFDCMISYRQLLEE